MADLCDVFDFGGGGVGAAGAVVVDCAAPVGIGGRHGRESERRCRAWILRRSCFGLG